MLPVLCLGFCCVRFGCHQCYVWVCVILFGVISVMFMFLQC